MSAWKKLASAPAASGAALNVEDVFSTYLWEGTSSALDITNNIDFTGEGGMLWIKPRSVSSTSHWIQDTERGEGKTLRTNVPDAELDLSSTQPDLHFSSDGFGVAAGTELNYNGEDMASFSFRKAPKFFDVVKYSGNSTYPRTINHNLGAVPGVVLIKCMTSSTQWLMGHRSVPTKVLQMNSTQPAVSTYSKGYLYAEDFTSTTFEVQEATNGNDVNTNGRDYIAYIFAHHDGDGEFGPNSDQDIIKCGSYTGDGNAGTIVDIGFEPQFILIKNASTSSNWVLLDNMRGFNDDSTQSWEFRPNTNQSEQFGAQVSPVANGIQLNGNGVAYNSSGNTYVYMAIRYGPMKIPESSSEVFDVVSYTANNTDNRVITTGNRVDSVLARNRNNTSERGFNVGDRHRALDFLGTKVTYDEAGDTDSFMGFDYNYGFEVGNDPTRRLNYSTYTQIAYTWTKSPYFFDTVLYKGNGSNRTIGHNLRAVPEMIWVKARNGNLGTAFTVYHAGAGNQYRGEMHNNAAFAASTATWNDTTPTDSVFSLGFAGAVNSANYAYIAYLFASLDGISKCGSFTGNGSSQTIDCGFSAGAQFVLIKGYGQSGDWRIWDSSRGIIAGNDPFLRLNSTAAEVTSTDWIDPHNSGFTVNATGGGPNGSGETYIFYAIA